MKKLLLLCFTIIPVLAFSQKAKIEFEKTSHNFGKISETGGNAVYDFVFKNTGTVPLILTNVRAGCGCTTPEWDRQPIAPNGTGHIRVSFNPLRRSGPFTKSITVNSNAENAVISLTIRGTIERKPRDPYANYVQSIGNLKLTASNLNFGTIKNTDAPEKTIEMINLGEQPLTITVTPASPHITATVKPETLKKGEKGAISIKYNAAAKNDWGFVSDKLSISTNHGKQIEIPVVANITEDFSAYKADNYAKAPVVKFSENEFDLGTLAKNTTKKHEFYIQNAGKSDLIIRKIKTSDDQNLTVTPAKMTIKPGKKVKVTLTLKTNDTPGKKAKIISFTFNDPKDTIVSYRLAGNVQ